MTLWYTSQATKTKPDLPSHLIPPNPKLKMILQSPMHSAFKKHSRLLKRRKAIQICPSYFNKNRKNLTTLTEPKVKMIPAHLLLLLSFFQIAHQAMSALNRISN